MNADKELKDANKILAAIDWSDESGTSVAAHRFMLDALELIRDKLPDSARIALDTAQRVILEVGPVGELVASRLRLWSELDIQYAGLDVDNPDVAGIRATICLLSASGDQHQDDTEDLLAFFMRLTHNVEPHAEEQASLLRLRFSRYLQGIA